MDSATVLDRNGNTRRFIGAKKYALTSNWFGGVTLWADGSGVGFWMRPISAHIGLASIEEIDEVRQKTDEHVAKVMGIEL